jgi:hypothetical protein
MSMNRSRAAGLAFVVPGAVLVSIARRSVPARTLLVVVGLVPRVSRA